jgi:hypothetical protein
LKSLSKYSHHLFLISSSLVRSRSVSSLMHLTWMMSLVFLSLLKTEEEEEKKTLFPTGVFLVCYTSL